MGDVIARRMSLIMVGLLLLAGCRDITIESAYPGVRGWQIPDSRATDAISGYADHVSVLPGQPVRLFVSSRAPSYTVTALRMGWYGGLQARVVWRSGRLPGVQQSAPVVGPAPRRTVVARWSPSLTVDTTGWTEGDYLFKLDAGPAGAHFVPLVVRSDFTAGRVVILNAVTTWQAYNAWGGYSLYHGAGGRTDFAGRARAVSFDRPYDRDGANLFLNYEQPVVAYAEKQEVPLAYLTTTDVIANPHLLDGARAILSLGHDEYWTPGLKQIVTAARDRGTNLAFLGANAVYRRIRLEPSALGYGADRVEVDYKIGREDPLYGHDNNLVTANFPDQPAPQPENNLTGMLYECFGAQDAYVIQRPDFWLFAGTGVSQGTRFPGLVGPEYDRAYPRPGTPRPLEVVAHSPVTCRGVHSYSDSAYYVARSGAAVFATGTMRWTCALAGRCQTVGVNAAASRFVRIVLARLLTAYAAGPAGREHPAVDNFPSLHEPARNATGAA
jgi:hypothetical protein